MPRLKRISAFALMFVAGDLSASTLTYAVGNCRPSVPSFPTIVAALDAAPSANVIEVCPGTYDEQLEITYPVTVEGVSNGTSARAVIIPPHNGLGINATDDLGDAVAVQLWVNNASGRVNISNLTVDGSGNKAPGGTLVAGLFYQNSSGTVNGVATRNQRGFGVLGIGIYANGGSSNPLVTIENNSVHDYNYAGIQAETNSATPELTAVIKGNEITTSSPNSLAGIEMLGGNAFTVTSNLIVNPGEFGIETARHSSGSISANTVINAPPPNSGGGIVAEADDVSVTSNKIFGSQTGILVLASSVAAIQNTITDSLVGIDLFCSANANVHSNIFTDVGTALHFVPSATATRNNAYFNVDTIRTGCS